MVGKINVIVVLRRYKKQVTNLLIVGTEDSTTKAVIFLFHCSLLLLRFITINELRT